MTLTIDALYHYSPRLHREQILKSGLQIYSPSISADGVKWPFICCGFTPSIAWGYSADMDWGEGIEEWDLWMIRPVGGDEIHYRSEWGPELKEARIHNTVPADRIWLCGTRERHTSAIDTNPPHGSWEEFDKRVDKMRTMDLKEDLKHEARLRHQAERDRDSLLC